MPFSNPSVCGRLGAHTLHSRHDSRETTQKARDAAFQRFLDHVDPDGALPVDERHRRARHAQRAHMIRIGMLAAGARRQRKLAATTGGDA